MKPCPVGAGAPPHKNVFRCHAVGLRESRRGGLSGAEDVSTIISFHDEAKGVVSGLGEEKPASRAASTQDLKSADLLLDITHQGQTRYIIISLTRGMELLFGLSSQTVKSP